MKKTKKSVKRKVHSIMSRIKKIQKMALNWYKGLFEEEKDKKKKNMQEIDTAICLKRADKI